MRNLSEVHGFDLLRRVANELIKKPEFRNRVWSDEMQCWGFFSDEIKETDIFLIMGCFTSGDMFRTCGHAVNLFNANDYKLIREVVDPYVMLDLNRLEMNGMSLYGLNLLSSNPPMVCQLLAEHKVLFKIAWESLR